MDLLLLGILSGLSVAVIIAVVRYVYFSNRVVVIPTKRKVKDKARYNHLNGQWNLYFTTCDASISNNPIWMHGVETITIINNRYVKGTTTTFHNYNKLDYVVQGEIRHGRMILNDNCIQDETDFASVLFPNLRSGNRLIGLWIGFDNDVNPISGPVVLSREELDKQELNRIINSSNLVLVPPADSYELHLADPEKVISQNNI